LVNDEFKAIEVSSGEHKQKLKTALDDTFEHISIDPSKWALLLTGGYDSRGTLLLLNNRTNLRCVTWGVQESIKEDSYDGFIAAKIANYLNLPHDFFPSDLTTDVEGIFNHYLQIGEGRLDHINHSLGGFHIWEKLVADGIQGVIRSDEDFGMTIPAMTPFSVREAAGLTMLSDYIPLDTIEAYGLQPQSVPEQLKHRTGESLATWRDRLKQQFRIPMIMAPQVDIVNTYLETLNPFLTRKIIYQVRTIPDNIRTGKKTFKSLIDDINIPIPFAKHPGSKDLRNSLKSPAIVEFLLDELNSSKVDTIFAPSLIQKVLDNIHSTGIQTSFRSNVLKYVPTPIIQTIKYKLLPPPLDYNLWAFRIYTIAYMNQILSDDAKSISNIHSIS